MMPGGPVFGVLFFGSLVLAGFTSLISLLQVVSAALQEKFGIRRQVASLVVTGTTGLLSVVLFSTTNGLNALDVVDKFANKVGSSSLPSHDPRGRARPADAAQTLRTHLNRTSTAPRKWWTSPSGIVNR
jgi:NSS family neurotransmitter:Na+ symporter